MVLTGISAKLKDRRVDRMLINYGYDVTKCEIFYSPITVWLFLCALLLLTLIPFSFYIFYLAYLFAFYFISYLIIGYLIVAYLNNSFVITEKKLLIINPNFPYRKFICYDLEQVNKIKMDSSKVLWITSIFAHFGSNYIEIFTTKKVERHYCTSLDVDAFDENFTEKTIDDFCTSLKQHGVTVEFKLL